MKFLPFLPPFLRGVKKCDFSEIRENAKFAFFRTFFTPPENRVFFTFFCTFAKKLFVIVINDSLSTSNDHVYTTTFDTF